jgi:rhamnose transport system ATP-binding protein
LPYESARVPAAVPAQRAGTPRLQLEGVTRSFGAIRALRDVSFEVRPAEIHGLVGGNGAGKSTLTKIITGVQPPDTGTLRLDGEPFAFASPMEARAAGMSAVYQDPKLFPHLDVAENIFVGTQPVGRRGLIDRRAMYAKASELLAALEVDLDVTALVAGLSVAEVQFVEIARALSADVRLLILDEPTAALTPSETERLFRIVRNLRDAGTGIVYISHRLEELHGFVDRITVLRDGAHVGTVAASDIDQAELIRMIIGTPLEAFYAGADDGGPEQGPERLRVENLGQEGVFEDVSFALCANEVVGLAGLVGAGRSEIARAICGIAPPTSGRVFVDGQPVERIDVRSMLARGIAYIPEDRDAHGLVMELSIRDNVTLPLLRRLARFAVRRPRAEREVAERFAEDLKIKATDVNQVVATLSGGNRQKVVLAKWLATKPAVIVLDEPTHGIDIATKAQVHGIIRELRDAGVGILVISSDLPELLAVSDRILVLRRGRIVADVASSDATEERITAAATANDDAGVTAHAA